MGGGKDLLRISWSSHDTYTMTHEQATEAVGTISGRHQPIGAPITRVMILEGWEIHSRKEMCV